MDTRLLLLLILYVCVVSGGRKKTGKGKKTGDDEPGLTKQVLCIIEPGKEFCKDFPKPNPKFGMKKQIMCVIRPTLKTCQPNKKKDKTNKNNKSSIDYARGFMLSKVHAALNSMD